MYAFAYHRPQSLADAARLLASHKEAKLLAGGHTLIPTMKQRLADPKALVDLSAIAELRGIARRGNALVIGAMVSHDEVAKAGEVRSAIAGLSELGRRLPRRAPHGKGGCRHGDLLVAQRIGQGIDHGRRRGDRAGLPTPLDAQRV